MTDVPPLLQAEALAIGYGGRAIVSGITAELPAGSITTLIGPNGVGKTTLFRTLLGLIKPVDGNVRLDGIPLSRLGRLDVARRVALVPQAEPGAFSYSVLDLVLMGRTARMSLFAVPGKADRLKAEECLERLGIAGLASRDMSQLSGGQRQLVLIARALAQEADLLIMDEPTSSLDLANAALVLSEIESVVADGTAILASSHDPAHALRLGGNVLALRTHGCAVFGPVEAVVTGSFLSDLYRTPIAVETLPTGRRVVLPGG